MNIDTSGMLLFLAVFFGVIGWGVIELASWVFSNLSFSWGG